MKKADIKLSFLIILLPWIITALVVVVANYGEPIDLFLNQFFESLLKALLL